MSDEEWDAQARRGGVRRWEVARAEDLRGEIESVVLRQKLEEKLVQMLDAKLPGTSEPDHEAVGYALLVIAENFRWSREELEEWVRRERRQLAREPRAYAFLDVDNARRRLLEAYADGRISRGDVPAGLLD